MTGATWGIVTTCAEPRKLVEAFVAHHLAIGASEIVIFFDDPVDGLAEAFSKVPNVTSISCDDAYWSKRRKNKGRPSGHRQRQTLNAEYAARNLCHSDWIAHIDVDEFLYPRSAESISKLLSTVPEHLDAARIMPAERMFEDQWLPGKMDLSGIFKLKPHWGLDWGHDLYGEDLGDLFPKGFQGHEVGKSFKRRSNREARFNIHFVRKDGENIPEHKFPQEEAVLLHLFPASFEDWSHKYERRIDDPEYFNSMPDHAQKRYSIYGNARKSGGMDAVRKLFEDLCVLSSKNPALVAHPELFLRADLKAPEKTEELVSPYIQGMNFQHMSEPSATVIPENQRVFQIGMNRGGSKEISAMFGRKAMSYAHWDGGRIAKNLKAAMDGGKKPFEGYEHYQLISDISYGSKGSDIYDGFYDFEYIAKFHPESIFLLNHRPVDEWLSSRRKFRNGNYITEHMAANNIKNEDAMMQKWKDDWNHHADRVRHYGERGQIRLIEYSLNTEKPGVFFGKLEKMLRSGL